MVVPHPGRPGQAEGTTDAKERGHPCDDIGQGYRQYHPGRPVILDPQSSQDIEIICILHERMDIEVRLSE